jgi:uncharacterized membrane protein
MSGQPAQADQNRLLAALAYPIGIIALVIIFTDMKKDAFLRHHGWTALFWGLGWIVIFFAVSILPFLWMLEWILRLGWFALSIYYAIQAYNGKEVNIPVVSDFAKKYIAATP